MPESVDVRPLMSELGSSMTLMRTMWSREADKLGIGLGGLAVLQAVSRRPEIRATEICQVLKFDKAVVSRKITQLRELGFIDATPSSEDGRVFLLTMTKVGQAEITLLREQLAEYYSEKLADWSQDDVDTLRTLVRRFNAAAFEQVG